MEISIKWNICRVCLQEEPDPNKAPPGGHMRYLFDDNSKELAKEIYECAGLMMRPDDNLPQKICRHCLTVLRYAVNFRKTCRESEEYLQSVIERTKSASVLFKLDRRQNKRLNFLDKNIENSYPYYDRDEEDMLVDDETECYVKIDTRKRKLRSNRFDGHTRKYKKRSSDISISSKLRTIEENDFQIHESNVYNEDDAIEIIIDKDDDEKHVENIEIEINSENEEDETVKIENETLIDTYKSVNLNDAKHSQKYEEDNNKPNETYMKSDHNNNGLGSKITDFANLHDFITKLTNPERINKEENFTTEECEDQDHPDSDIVERDEIYLLLNDNKEPVEVSAVIEKENETIKEETNLDLENFEKLVELQVTNIAHETCGDDKRDDQYFEECTTKVSCAADTQHSQNTRVIVNEYILPDVDENEGAKGDEVIDKRENKYKAHSTQRSKKVQEANANSNPANSSNSMLCDLCGNEFSSRFLLNIHLRSHRQEKAHECELCLKRFTTACYLQAHMRVHAGEKNCDCRFCGRRFTDRSTHIRHERVHTSGTPFTCVFCTKSSPNFIFH
uniref:Protein krueppel n=1 Tax=Glossina brevipalpis TaxID=37001 RepID=A0A1A9WM97_9MUSC